MSLPATKSRDLWPIEKDMGFRYVLHQNGPGDVPPMDAEDTLKTQMAEDRAVQIVNQLYKKSGILNGLNFHYSGANYFLGIGNASGAPHRVKIKDWILDVKGSNNAADGINQITMAAPPGAGTRTDFVWIECWLAEVAASSSTNKPSASTIYKYGNILYGGTNPTDQLQDPTLGTDTANRVQLQYEIRFASDAATAFGSANVYSKDGQAGHTFTELTDEQSVGLGVYRAQNDNAFKIDGSTGYSYAIPICKVLRTAGDNLIEAGDITDMQAAVTSPEVDFAALSANGSVGTGVNQVASGDRVKMSVGECKNIGVKYASNTLTICAADGTDLSASNPGRICVPSATAGQTQELAVTANATLTDGDTSDTDDCSFGIVLTADWDYDMPLYLYALNDSGTIRFGVSRIPTSQSEGAYAKGDTNCNAYNKMMALHTSAVTGPCICIGAVRWRFSTSNDSWTIQALGAGDGIGKFHETSRFYKPLGQNGSAAGVHTHTSGTNPTFTAACEMIYKIAKSGLMLIEMYMVNDSGGTQGAGAELYIDLPMPPGIRQYEPMCCTVKVSSVVAGIYSGYIGSAGGVNMALFKDDMSTLQAANFAQAGRYIMGSLVYSL